MCDLYVEMMCAGRIGLGWAHDVFTFTCHMIMHFSCIRTIFFFTLLILICVGTFLFVPLSLSLSLSLLVSSSTAPKHKSAPSWNLIHSEASTFDSTPSHIQFHDEKPVRTSRRTFHDVAFIRNAKLSYQTFLILISPLLSIVGDESHFVVSQSLVPLWSYRSFTLTGTDLIILYLISSLAFEVRVL